MYLIHEDDELAAQAFSRSQANEPENAVAWLGQAVLAINAKDSIEAQELYQHAFEIGERSFVRLHCDLTYQDCGILPLCGNHIRSSNDWLYHKSVIPLRFIIRPENLPDSETK
jgi:hypothetical protein